jgi:membrane fusion protein (multidrug efflux system)
MADTDPKPAPIVVAAPPAAPPPPPRPARWPLYAAVLFAIAFTAVVLFIIFIPGTGVSTDDAYVTVHYATIAPRIPGQIAAVAADDNQVVKAGEVLATIDDRDFQAALAMAKAQLARDRAQADDAANTLARQPSIIDQAKAQVESAAAQLAFAEANQRRYLSLARSGAGTVQDRQQADSALRQAEASLASGRAAQDSAQREIPIQEARRQAAMAAVQADEAMVQQAELNLSYTKILAPVDGVVAQRSVQVGNYVSPGSALMSVVPPDQIYIEANYRELALRDVVPRQHVRIHVDAYDVDLDGVVDSIAPASGAAFAPIEPNNATGNFTKIVQRLPVKILVSPGQHAEKLLRVGFSVETTIDTSRVNGSTENQGSPTRVANP